jgi:hypothetical protein
MKRFPIFAALGLAFAMLFAAGAPALAQNTSNYMVQGGATWEVGGTLDIKTGGKLTFNGVDFTTILTAQKREAQGETALGGSNPTAIATGLTTITSCTFSIKETIAPGLNTTTVTYGSSAGTANMYAWKPTSVSNPTLIASTGTETVGWQCEGT